MLPIIIQHTEILLLTERAAYIPSLQALLLADVHLGKGGHFRRHGIPVPDGTALADLHRLTHLVQAYPGTVFILGDLVHATHNEEWDRFTAVRRTWNTDVVLVAGNHDKYAMRHPSLGVQVVQEYQLGPFLLRHQYRPATEAYTLCGHVHPGVVLTGGTGWTERMPCFHITPAHMTFPAFGTFTGMHMITPQPDDRIVVVGGHFLHEVGT